MIHNLKFGVWHGYITNNLDTQYGNDRDLYVYSKSVATVKTTAKVSARSGFAPRWGATPAPPPTNVQSLVSTVAGCYGENSRYGVLLGLGLRPAGAQPPPYHKCTTPFRDKQPHHGTSLHPHRDGVARNSPSLQAVPNPPLPRTEATGRNHSSKKTTRKGQQRRKGVCRLRCCASKRKKVKIVSLPRKAQLAPRGSVITPNRLR